MKNKVFGIIGALIFVAAVLIGSFCEFKSADIVSIALAAFAFVSTIISIVKANKEAGTLTWKTILIIVLASVAGALVCVGGFTNSIFEQISGLVVALVAIIMGLISSNKNESK